MPRPRARLEEPPRQYQVPSFTFENITGRDFRRALMLWIALEILSFVVFPVTGMIRPGPRLSTWFWTSVPVGLVGALLVGFSSQYLVVTNNRPLTSNKPMLMLLGQAVGWLGMGGVLFPFLITSIEFFRTLTFKS